MRAIAIINQKGGCGKTTSAINLSAVLARAGKRVLLVDMDPQGHCAAGLGIPEQRIELDVSDAMLAIGQRPIDPAKLLWRAVRNLDLLPSRMKLAGLEAARGGLADLPDKERRLHHLLEKFSSDYDIAVIDCPPSIGLLTFNALASADMVLIPVETGFFSLQGATRQVNTVKTLGKRLGVNLPVWLLPTLHDGKNTVAIDLLEELHRRFKERVVPITIRHDQRLREAASFGQTIIDYAPGSLGAEDYGRLCVWTLENLHERMPLPPEQRESVAVSGDMAHLHPSASQSVVPGAGTVVTTDHVRHQPAATLHTPTLDAGASVESNEVKPISRAEDVARRAQEFLRRIALGRAPNNGQAPHATPVDSANASYDTNGHGSAATRTATLSRSETMTATSTTQESHQALRADVPHVLPARQVLSVQEAAPTQTQLIAPATQRLLGIRETSQGILFVQPSAQAKTIAIAGSFNEWSGTTHVMRRNDALGIHELCLRLPAGKFAYRIVVDGVWQNDPHNPNSEPNPFGDVNSIGYVGQR